MSEEKKVTVIESYKMDWEERSNGGTNKANYLKKLFTDPETNIHYHLRKYPKGFHVPTHHHSTSHGVYVLEGRFWSDGNVYEKGAFLWYPQGIIAEHGATDDEDVTVLFIADKDMETYYL